MVILNHRKVDKEVNSMTREGLCRRIRNKFKTDTAFAIAMGWTPQKVSKLKNGDYVPKLSEAVPMSRVLDITLDELASFFAQ